MPWPLLVARANAQGILWLSDNPRDGTSPGEMDWGVCSSGGCGGSKYALMHRGPGRPVRGQNASLGPTTSMSFSNDSINWARTVPFTSNGGVKVATGHGKPGLLGVPGGLLSTQMITKDPAERQPSDVVGIGMGLFASKDGAHYKLIRKLWPYGGGRTRLALLRRHVFADHVRQGTRPWRRSKWTRTAQPYLTEWCTRQGRPPWVGCECGTAALGCCRL